MSNTDQTPLRVGVVGATGKMGKVLCAAILDDPALRLVAAIGRTCLGTPIEMLLRRGEGGPAIQDKLDGLLAAKVDVAVDFSHPDVAVHNAHWYLSNRVPSVIGTTGFTPKDVEELRAVSEATGVNMVISPDFSPAGVIFLHIGKIFARHLDEVTLLEIHPPGKAEAPSGTTMNTARVLARVRGGRPGSQTISRELVPGVLGGIVEGIPVHAFRLSGVVGHEEMRFAHRGDTLTLKTTSHNREGYTAGVILGVKQVLKRKGLTWGLEPLLGL